MRSVVWILSILFATSYCLAADERARLVGSTYLFDCGDSAYEITIESGTELHWKLFKGDYPGPQEDQETYYKSKIADGIVLMSWIEASGLGVYNVLNFNNSTVTTHAREGDTTHINKGKVTRLP